MLALLLAPILFFGFLAWRDQAGAERLLPQFDAADVHRIEMQRAGQSLVIVREEGADWRIPSAADAPGDATRIDAALQRLAAMAGKPVDAATPAPPREPVVVRLFGKTGTPLAQAAFWTTEARRLPDGPRLAIAKPPALPLWPSAWSSQQPPSIDPASVVKAERLTPDGPMALTDAQAAEVATMLGRLAAADFVAASSVDWSGARMLRVTLVDGSLIDLAQVPDGEGRFHLRLASDTKADVRSSRRLAFRVSGALP